MLASESEHTTTGEPNSVCCPSCGSSLVRRSRRRGVVDRLYTIIGMRPFRCEHCDLRFFKRISLATTSEGN
jgi:hypothetical protein